MKNLADFLQQAKDKGCWVYGAAAGASTRYDQPDYTGGLVAVLGAEGKGLRPRVASMCDDLDLAATARAYRVAQCERHGRGAPVRDVAAAA